MVINVKLGFVNNELKWTCGSRDDNNNNLSCLLSTDPNIPSQPEPSIPSIYVTLGNDSIKAVTENLTWAEAKKRCEADKANLVSLRNEWTRAYVELLAMNLKVPVWIGMNKQEVQSF